MGRSRGLLGKECNDKSYSSQTSSLQKKRKGRLDNGEGAMNVFYSARAGYPSGESNKGVQNQAKKTIG